MIIEEVDGILSSFAVDAAALISQWSDIRLTFSQTEFYNLRALPYDRCEQRYAFQSTTAVLAVERWAGVEHRCCGSAQPDASTQKVDLASRLSEQLSGIRNIP